MTSPIHITSESDFSELLSTTKYVVVDFWATWCPPCKAISPIFLTLASKNTIPGKLAFAKVDLEEVPEIPEKYDVASIPAFLFFEDGKITQGLDFGPGKLKGPMVKFVEGTEKVTRIVGADPRSLTLVVGELVNRAKEESSPATASDAIAIEKREEINQLFAKEDENW